MTTPCTIARQAVVEDQKRVGVIPTGFAVVFSMLLGFHVAIILTTRLYPFVDLPNHLAAATVLRYYDSPSNQFAEYYAIDRSFQPNIFYSQFCSMEMFPSVESANRILLCLYVISLPFMIAVNIWRFGGNLWFSLFSFLLLYNYNLNWGFIGFVLSLPVVLAIIALVSERGKQNPRWGSSLLLGLLFILVFLMHVQMVLFAMTFYIIITLLRFRQRVVRSLVEVLPMLPAAVMLLMWHIPENREPAIGVQTFLLSYYSGEYWTTLYKRVAVFGADNYSLLSGLPGMAIGFFLSFTILATTGAMLVRERRRWRQLRNNDAYRGLLLFSLLSLLCYLLLPDRLPGQHFFYQRFVTVVYLSLILLCATTPQSTLNRTGRTAIMLVATLHLVLWASYFREFDCENRGFTRDAFPSGNERGSLAGLIYDNQFRGKPIYIHFPNYYIVWRQGICTASFIDYRFGKVRRKADTNRLPHYEEWFGYLKKYEGQYDSLNYVLVRRDAVESYRSQLPAFKTIYMSDRWVLLGH